MIQLTDAFCVLFWYNGITISGWIYHPWYNKVLGTVVDLKLITITDWFYYPRSNKTAGTVVDLKLVSTQGWALKPIHIQNNTLFVNYDWQWVILIFDFLPRHINFWYSSCTVEINLEIHSHNMVFKSKAVHAEISAVASTCPYTQNTGDPRYSRIFYLRIRLFTLTIFFKFKNGNFLVKYGLFICKFRIRSPK